MKIKAELPLGNGTQLLTFRAAALFLVAHSSSFSDPF